jgi:hypothetical protein
MSLADFGYRIQRSRYGYQVAGFGDDTCGAGMTATVAGCVPDASAATVDANAAQAANSYQVSPPPPLNVSGSSPSASVGGGSTSSSSSWTSALPGILSSTLGITGAVLGVRPGAGSAAVRPVAPVQQGMGIGTMLLIGLAGVTVIGGIAYVALKK